MCAGVERRNACFNLLAAFFRGYRRGCVHSRRLLPPTMALLLFSVRGSLNCPRPSFIRRYDCVNRDLVDQAGVASATQVSSTMPVLFNPRGVHFVYDADRLTDEDGAGLHVGGRTVHVEMSVDPLQVTSNGLTEPPLLGVQARGAG